MRVEDVARIGEYCGVGEVTKFIVFVENMILSANAQEHGLDLVTT